MLSVELRVDTIGIPHTFIVVTGPDGIERGYGFAPFEEGSLTGDGWIYNDTEHPYNASTGKIPLDTDSYNKLVDYIQESIDNPPPYYLPYGSQCANWAFKALTAAGIPASASPNLFPDNFMRDVAETILWNPYTQWLSIKLNNLFLNAKIWRPDPLILDLDGDGIETSAIGGWDGLMFDHNADGVKEGTGWVSADDGLLVLDRNGNGTIDSGRELFGDNTMLSNGELAADAFEALADQDDNGDGKIDASDAVFNDLRVWQDKNQDGISQEDELYTLEALGIKSISTQSEATNTNQNGNTITATSTFEYTDGSTGQSGSLNFAGSNFFTEFTDNIEIPEAYQGLPEMHGYAVTA